jgi:hypothetical protein
VASRFAAIERADWPVTSVDGITTNCSSARPQIFYLGDPQALRTRFTIAHELGHAVLPWHIGTAECAMPGTNLVERTPLEQEADHFASELLLPSGWLREIVARHRANLDLVLADVAKAQASATASMIALATVLPTGWALQLNNNDLEVTHEYGRILSRREAQQLSSASGSVEIHHQRIRWWRLFKVPPLPELPPDKETAYAMLDRVWGDYGHTAPSRQTIDGRVSGILGSLAGVLDLETGFGYLLWRLGEPDPLYEVAEFRGWLAWKAATRCQWPS